MNINDYMNTLYDNDLTLEEIIDAARKVKTKRDAEMVASKQKEAVKKARLNAVAALKEYLKTILTGDAFADFDFEECADNLVDKFEEMETELTRLDKIAKRMKVATEQISKAFAEKKTEKPQPKKSDDEMLTDFLKSLKSPRGYKF